MTAATHLCLVSAQATPNLTPALDPATAPERVILLVSPDMQRRADWLQGVLAGRGMRVERWPVDDAWDVEHLQIRVLELLEREIRAVSTGAIALNATGGTKPMSIAAYEAFRAYDLPIFYVHPERDRLIWMHPGARPAIDLDNRIRLEPFLQAHGTRIQSCRRDSPVGGRRALAAALAAGAAGSASALGTLNFLAARAQASLTSPLLEPRHLRSAVLQDLIDRLVEAGLAERDGDRLRFPDEDARFFANGGWLEEHVHEVIRTLRAEIPHIQDLARGVDITRETLRGETIPNEIDVACLAENRLYLVECKTRIFDGDEPTSPGADALYRLDTLRELLGGLQAQAMLVSYRDLPARILRRAADLRVRVCAGRRLPELAADIRGWLAGR